MTYLADILTLFSEPIWDGGLKVDFLGAPISYEHMGHFMIMIHKAHKSCHMCVTIVTIEKKEDM